MPATPNSPELQKRIIEAIEKKAPNSKCSLCNTEEWFVQLGTTYLPLQMISENSSSWSQQALPSAALVCNNCGNTQLLSLSVLLPDWFPSTR